jgi:hypothetical protein
MPHFMLRLCAPNDANGNPRRGWLTFNSDGLALAFYEEGEGCEGVSAIPDPEIRSLAMIAPRINVALEELEAWRHYVTNC